MTGHSLVERVEIELSPGSGSDQLFLYIEHLIPIEHQLRVLSYRRLL